MKQKQIIFKFTVLGFMSTFLTSLFFHHFWVSDLKLDQKKI
ncbi:hypothetical protein pb186bvf_012184 [Paramecium bursaria]